MDLKQVVLIFTLVVSLSVGAQGKAIKDSEGEEDFSDDLSDHNINYENKNSEGEEDFIDDLSEDKINYENKNPKDKENFLAMLNEDNINSDDEESEDGENLSDGWSEDKINYEDEKSNDGEDFTEAIAEDKTNLSDANSDAQSGTDESAAGMIYETNQGAHILNETFEEDILVDPDREAEVEAWINGSTISKRNAKIITSNIDPRWQDKTLIYDVAPNTPVSSNPKPLNDAIREISDRTCIKFVKRTGNTGPYVRIISDRGCYSYVGLTSLASKPDGQKLSIGPGCNYKGIIIHELLHALGFWHEQSRPDRDRYVRVLFENILPDKESNFKRHAENKIQETKVPYDYESVMHYSSTAFSKNRKPTIIRLDDATKKLGQRNGLSPKNIQELNNYYSCSAPPPTTPSTTLTTTPNPTVSPGSMNCNFDNGFCEWKNVPNKYRFSLRRSRTPSYNTGPTADHTSGAGRYIYFETSGRFRSGSAFVQLESKLLGETDALCLTFWYHMYGRAMGSLRMGILSPKSKFTQLWSKQGDQGQLWKEAMVTVKSTSPFRISFEARRGTSYTSDIALDDIVFTKGACVQTSAPTSIKCIFKGTMCGFKKYGLSVNEFRNRGSYVSYWSTRGAKENEKASMISTELAPTTSSCLNFRYKLTGSAVGSLVVYLVDKNVEGKKELFKLNGNHGYEWFETQVHFKSLAGKYKLIFEGSRSRRIGFSFVAIHHISVNPGACKESECGIDIYKPDEHICCAGVVHDIQRGHQCCGSEYYDTAKYQCCSKGSLDRVETKFALC